MNLVSLLGYLIQIRGRQLVQARAGWLWLGAGLGFALMGGITGAGLRLLAAALASGELDVAPGEEGVLAQIPAGMLVGVGALVLFQRLLVGWQLPFRLVERHHPLPPWGRVVVHFWLELWGPAWLLSWAFLLPFLGIAPAAGGWHLLAMHLWLGAMLGANQRLRIALAQRSLLRQGLAVGLTLAQVGGLAYLLLGYWEQIGWGIAGCGLSLGLSLYGLWREERGFAAAPAPAEGPLAKATAGVSLFRLKLKTLWRNPTGRYWVGVALAAKVLGIGVIAGSAWWGETLDAASPLWNLWVIPIFALLINRFGTRTELTLWQLQRRRAKRFWLGQYFDRYFWLVVILDGLISLPVMFGGKAPISLPWAYGLFWLLAVWLSLLGSFYLARRAVMSSGFSFQQKNPMSWRVFVVYMLGLFLLGPLLQAPPLARWLVAATLVALLLGTLIILTQDRRLGYRLQQDLEAGPEYAWAK